MALSLDQANQVKDELLKQLDRFPEDKRAEIKKQVEDMPVSQVEQFVKDNQLTHMGGQCMFCGIVSGSSPSFRVGEDDRNVAVLDINPLSRGHSLVIPKSHADTVEDHTRVFAEGIASLLEDRLKPQKVEIKDLSIMGHALLQVVPLFGTEGQRWSASNEELQSLHEELTKPKEVVILPSKDPTPEEQEELDAPLYELPPRIP